MSGFGERLKETRKFRKFTQKSLAENLNVAQSTIANYENNVRFPGSDNLKDISSQLGVSVDYLLGLEKTEKKIFLKKDIDFLDLHIKLVDKLLNNRVEEAKSLVKDINKTRIKTTEIIEKLFIPALRLVGEKWQKNEISIAEEHYITEVIEKLFSFISESRKTRTTKNLRALFMAPQGEEHIINLKMSTEYFKLRGWNKLFIGGCVPSDDLIKIIIKDKIDLVVMSCLSQSALNSASYIIASMRLSLKDKMPIILLGGNDIISTNKKLVLNYADYYNINFNNLDIIIKKIENEIIEKRSK